MLATPAMACTDWKAIAAFDAIIAANNAATRVEDIKFIDSMGASKISDRTKTPLIRTCNLTLVRAPPCRSI
jgi:hypothetical protein